MDNKPVFNKKLYITQKWLMVLFLFSILLPGVTGATEPPGLVIEQHWFVDESAGLSVAAALERFERGDSQPLKHDVFRLGNDQQQIWIYLQADNQTDSDRVRRLLLESPYTTYFQAMLLPGASQKPVILLEDSDQRPFSERNNHFRWLNSEPFSIKAGASAAILIKSRFDGPTFLRIKLLAEQAFYDLRLQDGVAGALFYSFSLTVALLFLLLSLAARQALGVMFSGLFLLGLMALADVDGYALRFFWPEWPQLEIWSPLIVLPLLNALGFMTCRQILRALGTDKLRRLQLLAVLLTVVSLGLPLLLPFLLLPTLVQAELILTMLMFLLLPLAFVSWLGKQKRNGVLWLFLLLVSGTVLLMTTSMLFFELVLPEVLARYFHYLIFLLISLAVMGSMTIHIMGMNKDLRQALNRELDFARREAEMNRALFKSEQAYTVARELAQSRQQQLATASHDIRQPLTSLRSTLDAVIREQTPELRRQLRGSLDYIEQLCSNYLSKNQLPANQTTPTVKPVTEAYPADLILSNVQRMFADEAEQAGVEIRRVACRCEISVPSLVMMRMVSNLVANAIKHHKATSRPRVLLGCRRRQGKLWLMVCDNSRGMTEQATQDFLQPYHKGEDSTGTGLGLAIIRQLATEQGVEFEIASEPGRGSCFSLGVSQ